MMGRRFGRWGAVTLLAGVFVLLNSAPALADHFDVDVSAPDEGALGETIRITATVRDIGSGDPAEGVELVFFSSASLAGVDGFFALGKALTNDLGVAVFDYELRRLGTHTITIEGGGEPNIVSIPVAVGGQLYRSSARIALIPGAGGLAVTLVIASVWIIMIIVGVAVVRVARPGKSAEAETSAKQAEGEQVRGSSWLNAATAMTAVMLTVATGLVALLIRSPNTQHNNDPEGYNRSAVAFVEADYLYPDFGLNPEATVQAELGRGLFVSFGCTGCHGVDAEGTTTAKSPTSASYDWVQQVVRNGLPGMPSYSLQELSETELNEIFAFLAESRG